MTVARVAVIYDDALRPETTGVYCLRALSRLVEAEHLRPAELTGVDPGRFDLFLYVDDGLAYSLPECLKPAAYWAIDTHIDFARALERGRQVDCVLAAQRDGAQRLQAAGVDTASWLPLACDPDVHGKQDLAKKFDVCFVGNLVSPERSRLLGLLKQRYPSHWVGQRYFEDMARVYSESRIVFNRSLSNDVNMRVFEGLCSGSLLMTNALPESGQDELFRDGVHLATYASDEELCDKINWYLAHDREREQVAAAGRQAVVDRNTYRQRMQTLLTLFELQCGSKCSETRVSSIAVSAPISSANKQHRSASQRPSKDPTYFDFARPEVVALVPTTARCVLDVGCGAGRLGASIKGRQEAEVLGIELDPHAAESARQRLDEVIVANVEDDELTFPAARFDCITCADILVPRQA